MNNASLADDIFAQPLPDFFPEVLKKSCAGKRIAFRIPRAVRERMQVPENLTVSEWAEKHRRVTEIDAAPGRWRIDLVPHTKKPMDVISLPYVKEVWLCMVERAAKTQILVNSVLWQIDRGIDSGNVFWLMPSENEANKALGERLIPVLKATPRTARLLSRYVDDTTRKVIRFKHGPRLLPAWSNSPSSISSFFGKINIGDEIDKFSDQSGGETDPITLLKKRGRDSDDSKFIFASSPAGKYIYKGAMSCQQVWAFKNCCPHCGEHVLMDQDHFVIPEGADLESVKHGIDKVGYECNSCKKIWNEADRKASYHFGNWFQIKGEDIDRPITVGFHMPAWPLPNIPMAEIGAAILKEKTGTTAAKRDLAFGYAAADLQEKLSDRKEDVVLRLCDDRHSGLVHPHTDILTISIDTQDHGFWYTLRGWQFGEALDSWLVRCGYLPSSRPSDFSALDKIIFESEYKDPLGVKYQVTYGIIDTQGHRTAEVYAWCKRTGIFAARGAQGRKSQPVTVSRQEFFPGNHKPIPGGLMLYHLDTHFHKDLLANKLLTEPGDPGAWMLHSGFSSMQHLLLANNPGLKVANGLEQYAKQMCVEYRDEKGLWVCPEGKANHLWDCEQQQVALASYLGFANAVSEKNADRHEQEKEQSSTQGQSSSDRPSWWANRGRR